jgi:hypothetical protein
MDYTGAAPVLREDHRRCCVDFSPLPSHNIRAAALLKLSSNSLSSWQTQDGETDVLHLSLPHLSRVLLAVTFPGFPLRLGIHWRRMWTRTSFNFLKHALANDNLRYRWVARFGLWMSRKPAPYSTGPVPALYQILTGH